MTLSRGKALLSCVFGFFWLLLCGAIISPSCSLSFAFRRSAKSKQCRSLFCDYHDRNALGCHCVLVIQLATVQPKAHCSSCVEIEILSQRIIISFSICSGIKPNLPLCVRRATLFSLSAKSELSIIICSGLKI
jgi:hypothetical protein